MPVFEFRIERHVIHYVTLHVAAPNVQLAQQWMDDEGVDHTSDWEQRFGSTRGIEIEYLGTTEDHPHVTLDEDGNEVPR